MSQLPSKGSPGTLKQPQPGSRAAQPAAGECRATVRYYRRMKLQHVYALLVEGPADVAVRTASGALPPPLTVRPVVPGAHVTPDEGQIDFSQAGSRITFYVTPLARGRLQGARVELLHQGLLVHDIPVPMKSVTHRRTLILAALTLLIPAFLLYIVRNPLTGTVTTTTLVSDVNPAAPNAPPEQAPVQTARTRALRGGDALEKWIKDNTWDFPLINWVAAGLREAYNYSITLSDGFPVAFVLFVLLAGLTMWSLVANQPQRGVQRGKSLMLRGEGGGRGDSIPATRRIESPSMERTE